MNPLHDIEVKSAEEFLSVIEISKNSKMKYEIHKETGLLYFDRVLTTAFRYPANYGFIPQTLCEDGDALDVFVLGEEEILPMTIVKCKPIGVFEMVDDGERDEKIIAVPIYKGSHFAQFNDISDLVKIYPNIIKEMEHFFRHYKDLANGNVKIEPAKGRKEAIKVIKEAMEFYKKSK